MAGAKQDRQTYGLTKSEYQLLCLMWQLPSPKTKREICELYPDFAQKHRTSFHLIVNGLIEKGFIAPVDWTKGKQSYSRSYFYAVTPYEYVAKMLRDFTPDQNDDIRLGLFTKAFKESKKESE